MLAEIGGGGLQILPFPLFSHAVSCVTVGFVVADLELAVPDIEVCRLTRLVLGGFIASRISRSRGGVLPSSTSVLMCPSGDTNGLNGESELEEVSEARRKGILKFL